MTLNDLHRKFSKDATYRQAYEDINGIAEIVAHCIAAREDRGWSQKALAEHLGITERQLSRFESFEPVEAGDISCIVKILEQELRERGVDCAQWVIETPKRPATSGDENLRGRSRFDLTAPRRQAASDGLGERPAARSTSKEDQNA